MMREIIMTGGHTKQIEKNEKQKLSRFVYILTFVSALGGFLFGYDTGVVSGALVVIKAEFQMTSMIQEIFVSITMGSAMIFSLVSGFTSEYFGRKMTILIASVAFLIGSVVLAFANSVYLLLIGRLIVGIGIGFSSASIPMYIAECSPRSIRGQLVSINTLFITGGQFISCLICGIFSFDLNHGWRYMLGLAAVPAFIQFIFFIFMPESPRWLYQKGNVTRALMILEKIELDDAKAEEELNNIRISLLRNDNQSHSSFFTIMRILKTSHIRRALMIGVTLQLTQQFVGINTVMYYSATIIQMSGTDDPSKAIWMAAIVALVNFLFTFVGLLTVDRMGRRKLILLSLLGTFFSLIVLGTGFLLSSIYSASVNAITQPSACSQYTTCGSCITDPHCGFCYTSANRNTTCIQILYKFDTPGKKSSSFEPLDTSFNFDIYNCGNKTDMELITKFCPTQFAWMSIFGLVLYLAFFAPGMGPMPWTINSEIYPGWARSSGNSFSTCANWFSNLIVSMTFLTLTETMTPQGAFYLYAGAALFGLLILYLFLPETKGKSLEEIENLFKEPLLVPCKCKIGAGTGLL